MIGQECDLTSENYNSQNDPTDKTLNGCAGTLLEKRHFWKSKIYVKSSTVLLPWGTGREEKKAHRSQKSLFPMFLKCKNMDTLSVNNDRV